MDRQRYTDLIAPAIALVVKKGEDYNSVVELKDYFPFGDISYIQMIYMKALRLVSLAENTAPNFEGKLDTVLDLINYCVFYLDHMRNENEL